MKTSVRVIKYEIIITDLKTGLTDLYTYSTYDEAINYYAQYRNAFKDCKIELYAMLMQEVL